MAIGTAEFEDYLAIDGVNVSHLLIDVKLGSSVQMIENTAGTETAVSRFPTVEDYNLNFTVGVTENDLTLLLPLIRVGMHSIVYGMRGYGVGKPKHAQDFIVGENSISGNVKRGEKRYFSVNMQGSGEPISNMYNEDTF